jgi:serine/threonine protein kinase, bacterial
MTITQLNNRYQVIKVLGAGGFGETFLAEDTHMPSRRRCVIKQLKPIANDPKTYEIIQQRFEREAATLEYLGESSDQIPKLYAYFSENGLFYLVQEWIQGQTLTDIVEAKGAESETVVREILVSLLSVLNYVHSKGIIHRDIKPDNIILRSSDSKPVLIDFGAVKETIRSVVSSSHHPTRSLVIGTPGYMPTEQAIGRPVYATDIYSLGLTAIYLLTGKHPPELQTNPQTGEILWQDLAPNVSPNLANVINQAIKPHVSDRYSTASKMLYELKSVSNHPKSKSDTTAATISLSPGGLPKTHNRVVPTTQKTQAISSTPTIVNNNWQKPALIISSLVLGGFIGGVAISQMIRQPQTQQSITTSSPPAPTLDTDTTPAPEPSPPEPEEPPVAVQPRVEREVPIQPQPEVVPTLTPEPDLPIAAQPPEDEVEQPPVATEEPAVTQEPPPVVIEEPPAPPPTPETPKQQNQKPAPNNPQTRSIPAFPTGTTQEAVKAALGQPSRDTRGLWNTRAFLYRLEENVDLGYLFDRNTGILRQTEVSFAQSVPPEVMQNTLQGMLRGQANNDIKQGLQRVRDRQTNRHSFNVGGLRGVIERNQQDRIYIGVWDADLQR